MNRPRPRATGTRHTRDGTDHLVLSRTFRAPIDSVWAAVTDPERLNRWIGTWDGDPASGRVNLRMIFEETPWETYVIEVCEEPHRLRVRTDLPDVAQIWTLDLRLSEADGVTTLNFAQVLTEHTDVTDVGPGWDYYLDRLTVAVDGGDVSDVAWDERYTALADDYGRLFGT